MSWFDKAFEYVLGHEGGYVNDPLDPGGKTKFGISSRTYPDLDIANLSVCQAKEIYKEDWWVLYGYDRINDFAVATKVFDLAVNIGPSPAHKILQRALHATGQRHVTVDGLIGPQTLAAFEKVDLLGLMAAIKAEAAWHYRNLVQRRPELQRFINGWLNRAYSDPDVEDGADA